MNRGSRVRFAAGAGNFSLHHRVQNGSGAHPASYPMGNRSSFPGGKADHSPPLVPRLMRGHIPRLPPYVFVAWCLGKHRKWLWRNRRRSEEAEVDPAFHRLDFGDFTVWIRRFTAEVILRSRGKAILKHISRERDRSMDITFLTCLCVSGYADDFNVS
jgi:hypothetical protein